MSMSRPWMGSWPADLATTFEYRNGEQPLHAYLADNAAEAPDRAAYVFYGREVTWSELHDAVRRLAGHLRAHGVEKGDRIGVYLQNCPQYVIAHYAIQMLGGIVCPLNPQYKAAEVEYLLSESQAKGVIAGEDLYPMVAQVRERLPDLDIAVTTAYADFLPEQPTLPVPEDLLAPSRTPAGTVALRDVLADQAPLTAPSPVDLWEDVALMTFTSGTTGRPKGAMLTFGNALFKTAAFFHAYQMGFDTTSLAIAPLCHIAGMVNGVNMPVYSRGTAVVMSRFDPETTVQAFEKYRCSMWYSIAPMNAAILELPGIEGRDLSSLTLNPATSFGIPVTEALAEKWRALTGCQMHEAAFGLSETHTCDTFMPRGRIKFGSCGIPVYGTDLKILDLESGAEQPPGGTGEIAITNPGVFKGYWNRPDATAETLREGWVHTGDVGYLDEEGYLYFTGRVKEMIKCSGYSVFPEDVEALLQDHPAIAQSAVIGVPDDKRGESVKAFVVLKPDCQGQVSEQEIIDWSREHMANYKYPRYVEFRDSLPATGAGKVLRRLLKEE
ncbi:AMP-binding protein [Ectothiorhodospiraceae bacterium WFHF3C12]|nr:AMP-binding protein [Ectothiorhodospiraceae bacterium WFHF3C12]